MQHTKFQRCHINLKRENDAKNGLGEGTFKDTDVEKPEMMEEQREQREVTDIIPPILLKDKAAANLYLSFSSTNPFGGKKIMKRCDGMHQSLINLFFPCHRAPLLSTIN